jgi:hypothetical protein
MNDKLVQGAKQVFLSDFTRIIVDKYFIILRRKRKMTFGRLKVCI